MNTLLQTTLALLIGSVITVNGITAHVDDITASAKSAVNGANVHQMATALELYYSDHNSYPAVSGGEELVNTLEHDGYIMNRPLDASVFAYSAKDNGQNYSLKLN